MRAIAALGGSARSTERKAQFLHVNRDNRDALERNM